MPCPSPPSPCEGCHAGCCRSFAVPISGADVLRLERTGLSFWDFATRWADENGAIANGYAPHLHFADEPQTPFVLGLSHVESRVFPGTPKCRFLSETDPTGERPLGVGRCGTYESRPAACRVFPKKLDERGELVQLQPVPARGRDSQEPQFRLCPRPWTAADVDPVETPGEIVTAEFEMRFFAKVAALWNRTPGGWLTFPTFLRSVYAARVVSTATTAMPAGHAGDMPTGEPSLARPADVEPPPADLDADPVILKFPTPADRGSERPRHRRAA